MLLKDAQRRRFDVVMAWAIDRLGRSLIDLLATISLEACGVDLYLDQQSIDTTTPVGRLMFQITGAVAEFERSMIRQRVHRRREANTSSTPRQKGHAGNSTRPQGRDRHCAAGETRNGGRLERACLRRGFAQRSGNICSLAVSRCSDKSCS
jgi:DNA invertase Pin-like site-specific DNA recombinase